MSLIVSQRERGNFIENNFGGSLKHFVYEFQQDSEAAPEKENVPPAIRRDVKYKVKLGKSPKQKYENRSNHRSHIKRIDVSFRSLTYFLNLVPQPDLTGNVKIFMDVIAASGYIMPVAKVFEFLCGLAFVSGRFVTLAIVLIFPIALNILLINAF